MFGVKKKLGFGCMRLPMKDNAVDEAEFCRMIDYFIENGFNYFDTAHGYLNGLSEKALRTCLTDRYPREAYILTDKLSVNHFDSEAEIRPLFEEQLRILGVEYLDFYLMHAQDATSFEKYKKCRAYETAIALRAEGKIRHFGISFHDKADVLERILTEYPQIETVQIQLNYLDFDDPSVQSGKCLEVCRKHGKPVIVMEPVKGGSLARLPEEAQAVFDRLGGHSAAGYAIRYAAGFPEVLTVLSGMGDMEMMRDNVARMKDFTPLSEEERAAVDAVCAIFRKKNLIPCTGCAYCTQSCPMGIRIPAIFACLNARETFHNWNSKYYYNTTTAGGGKAGECLECGACEGLCPQHLPIRDWLKKAAEAFEK